MTIFKVCGIIPLYTKTILQYYYLGGRSNMKKIYETPAVEITVLETSEDILAGSNDVIVDVADLWGTVDAGTEA